MKTEKKYPFFIKEKLTIIIPHDMNQINWNEDKPEFHCEMTKESFEFLEKKYNEKNNEKFYKEVKNQSIAINYKLNKTHEAVDGILISDKYVMLIDRVFPPLGYAMPGGFIDEGEIDKDAAKREFAEEVSLKNKEPKRICKKIKVSKTDPRSQLHADIFTTPFAIELTEKEMDNLIAGSDAKSLKRVLIKDLINGKQKMAFKHHEKIIKDYLKVSRKTKKLSI